MSVVIVAYEVDGDLPAALVALDAAPSTLGAEVFRQATGEHIDLERAFVVAARSFGAPMITAHPVAEERSA